ncbi:MAG TPA: C4-type zinc ribbon domain-containing protein [Spirochaetales bacterium]|nr:C4-type zinc ribbon domain-containing protein [Spirochaetales bacterium]
MLMEEVFTRLRKFQEILTERVQIEREIHEVPKSLNAQEELLARVKKTYLERNAEFEEATARVSDLRNRLAEAEAAREKAEKQMDVISTQREYEALNKEIRDATDLEQNLRKELQREERALTEAEAELRKSEAMIQLQEGEVTEKRQKIEQETSGMRQSVERLRADELDATDGLDADVIFKFERIIRSKQGVGIVPVRGYVCTGCSMILPAHFVNEVRQGNKIIFCPYCSRVLQYEERLDGSDDELVAEIESGSLADLDDFSEEGEDDSYDEGDDDSEKDEGEEHDE